ncbi:MAG: hypothetical protein AABW82_02155 [Nanoarchaeota archaeon]
MDDLYTSDQRTAYESQSARTTPALSVRDNTPFLSRVYRAKIDSNTQRYVAPEILCSLPESTPQSDLDALRLLDMGRFAFTPSAQLAVRAKEIGLPIIITEERDSIRIGLSPNFRDLDQLTGFLSNNMGVGPFLAEAA